MLDFLKSFPAFSRYKGFYLPKREKDNTPVSRQSEYFLNAVFSSLQKAFRSNSDFLPRIYLSVSFNINYNQEFRI